MIVCLYIYTYRNHNCVIVCVFCYNNVFANFHMNIYIYITGFCLSALLHACEEHAFDFTCVHTLHVHIYIMYETLCISNLVRMCMNDLSMCFCM